MKFLRRFLCKLFGHRLEHVRMREVQVVNRLDESVTMIVVEHSFCCTRCKRIAYRESMAFKDARPGCTAVLAFGPAKWTGLE